MADYISREAAIDALENIDADVCKQYPDGYCDWGISRAAIKAMLKNVPAADVKPVRFTVAIPSEMEMDYYGTWGECQSCGYDGNTVSAKYCGGCGTRLIWRVNNGD